MAVGVMERIVVSSASVVVDVDEARRQVSTRVGRAGYIAPQPLPL
jgi:hypothetical protein